MRIVPTVRVSDGSGGSIVINDADFDPVVHQRVDEPPGVASPEPVAQEPEPRRSIYRKYKNSFPGGLSPESGIVVQAR